MAAYTKLKLSELLHSVHMSASYCVSQSIYFTKDYVYLGFQHDSSLDLCLQYTSRILWSISAMVISSVELTKF